jgi:hypothetical protein
MHYTDPVTGFMWSTTELDTDETSVTHTEPTPAELRADATRRLTARGQLTPEWESRIAAQFPDPTFSDIGQGIIDPPKPIDMARFNDHQYYLTHKAELEEALRNGSYN